MIIAVDPRFLLGLADGDEEVWQLYAALLDHDQHFALVATPSVFEVIDFFWRMTGGTDVAKSAQRAWQGLNGEWAIKHLALSDTQRKIAWILTYHFRQLNLVAADELLAADILSEAVLTADFLLTVPDSVFAKVDPLRLCLETRLVGMSALAVTTPARLLKAISE